MRDIDGEPGELIDAFLSLLDPAAHGSPERLAHAEFVLALAIGGTSLTRVKLALPEFPALPGSVGEQILLSHEAVNADQYLQVVRALLMALTEKGIDEAFLVRSLCDHFTRHFEGYADTAKAKAKREESRKFMLELAKDPQRLSEMQQRLAEKSPDLAELHADQFADRLRDMAASQLVGEPDVEEASRNWSALQSWTEDVATVLSDEDSVTWDARALSRQLRDRDD